MDIISTLKARRTAAQECISSPVVSEADKQQLIKGEQFMEYSYYISKGVIAAGFIFLVDWKKSAPITRREVPLALLAFGLCAASDYAASEYNFSQNEKILLNYTGFKDGIYVSPSKFMKMKSGFRNQAEKVFEDSSEDLFED